MDKHKERNYKDDTHKSRGITDMDKHTEIELSQTDKHKDRGITQMTNIKVEELPR